MSKPIRVFYSELDGQFYASSAYRTKTSADGKSEMVTITGQKWNVTQDIARLIVHHQIEFMPQRGRTARRK